MPDPRIFPIPDVNNNYVTVLLVSTEILPANTHRVDLELVNDSDQIIYISRGEAAVIGNGIRLNANGGSYTMDTQNLYLGAFYGIAEGFANITYSEGVKP